MRSRLCVRGLAGAQGQRGAGEQGQRCVKRGAHDIHQDRSGNEGRDFSGFALHRLLWMMATLLDVADTHGWRSPQHGASTPVFHTIADACLGPSLYAQARRRRTTHTCSMQPPMASAGPQDHRSGKTPAADRHILVR
ncbi:hypothetical protein XOC_4645 [Xanthomonas oryzae pv. oryzicola BLS256]|uniref:Transposase n=1 Tax=Xanthomonas oryzae pv. oryzicola (strain BLS256) TaxID=383407 RepID=G7TC89_XANOB|nr:hypothetical protein XOC_4645 [Xanthomonas oryzae pv. oryzicola BLS256]